MEFFSVSPGLNYLESISKWIVANYQGKLDSLKIFLPNGLLCQSLTKLLAQEIFASEQKDTFFLPTLIPLSNISDYLLAVKIGQQTFTPAKRDEQILALAKAISMNDSIKISDALEMARQLNQNFEELFNQNIDLRNVELEAFADKSIYLQQLLQSILFYFEKSREILRLSNKLTSYEFFHAAINSYQASGNSIFIGTTRQSKAFNQFIAKNIDNPHFSFILPPIDLNRLSCFEDSNNLLNFLKIKKEHINPIASTQIDKKLYLSQLIEENAPAGILNLKHVSLLEADNEIEESNLILLFLKDFIDQNKQHSVAVICPNYSISALIKNNLRKYGIEFADFIGHSFIGTSLAQFILHLADYFFDFSNVEKLILLLKHPYIFCKNSVLLEEFIRKHKFVTSVSQIVGHIENSNDQLLQKWWYDFFQPIQDNQFILESRQISLRASLEILLNMAQKIYQPIWHLEHSSKSIDFFADLLESSYCLEFIEQNEFVEFLKSLLRKTIIKEAQKTHQISLISPENALYLNFDLLILADMNESSWPNLYTAEMWLTNKLRRDLNIADYDSILREKIHDFYLLLCNSQVIITRSKKIAGSSTVPSKLLQKILHAADAESLKAFKSRQHYLQFLKYSLSAAKLQTPQKPFIVSCQNFPSSVSATSVELLIKNPYAFFARNILKLYPLKELTLDSMSAEFGTLVHKIIATYNASIDQDFLNIARQEFKNANVNDFMTKLWWPKVYTLAEEYTKFSIARRNKIKHLRSEISGKMHFDYGDKRVQITAIADEIVLTKDDSIEILDYKTGAPPSEKEVLCGLAPQLVLEALMVRGGGFTNIEAACPDKLIFVKISSSELYLIQIAISDFQLGENLAGLQNLLSHYASKDAYYPAVPSQAYAPKYNDYKHLGRK